MQYPTYPRTENAFRTESQLPRFSTPVSIATGNSGVSPASVAVPFPGFSSCDWKCPESGRRKSSEVSTFFYDYHFKFDQDCQNKIKTRKTGER